MTAMKKSNVSLKDEIRRSFHKVIELGESFNTFNLEDAVVQDVIKTLLTERVYNCETLFDMDNITQVHVDRLILEYGKDDLNSIIRSRINEQNHNPPKFIFFKEEEIWHLGRIENPQVIKSKNIGFDYLNFLLSRPGKSISAIELYQSFKGVSEKEDIANKGGVIKDPVLDSKAIRDFKIRISKIDEELEDTELLTEIEKDNFRCERDEILSHMKKAASKSRTTSDPNKEKIRGNVKSSIGQALDKIKKQSPVTYLYLKQGINKGHTLVYTPNSGFPSWELHKKSDL